MADSPALALREFSLEPSDNDRLANLCGPLDENLRLVESRLGVEVRRRGSSFRVQGDKAIAAEALLRELFRITRTEDITPETVHLALRDHDTDQTQRSRSPAESAATPQGAGVESTAAIKDTEVVADVAGDADDAETGLRTLRGTIQIGRAHV
mgnify:FL=1